MKTKKQLLHEPKIKDIRQRIKEHQKNIDLLLKRIIQDDPFLARTSKEIKIIQRADERVNYLAFTLNNLVIQIIDLSRELFAIGHKS